MDRPPSRGATATVFPDIPDVELTEVVGTGGSGIVYRGHQQGFGRDVAVKVVSSAGSVEGDERWQRELIAVGRVSNHPNIVPVYSGGVTSAGLPYLVMPYVPGGTLQDRIDRSGPMPAGEVATIGTKLAGALATAHAAGVLHRDMKPANVLVSPYGEPQVTDFGVARLLDATMTVAGSVVATIRFAAPEIVSGGRATEAADVYGLGATLHTCLTGEPPFAATEHDTMVSIAARVVNEPPASLRDRGVPAALADVVDRAMAKDPADRQESALELQRELERATALLSSGSDPEATAAIPPTVLLGATPAPKVEQTQVLPSSPPQRQVPAPAPAPSTRRVGPEPSTSLASSRLAWIGFLVIVAVLGALAVWLLAGDDDPTTADPSVPPATEAPAPTEASAPPSSEATTTTAAETTTSTTEQATTTEAQVEAPAASAAADTAASYLEALDAGDLDTAWSLTSAEFQSSQDRAEWAEFWSGFDSIEMLAEPTVSDGGSTVVVPLDLDGQREDYVMYLVPGDDGSWLIDGPTG